MSRHQQPAEHGPVFKRMIAGAPYKPDAECHALSDTIYEATKLFEQYYARSEHAQAMHVLREHLGAFGTGSFMRPSVAFDYGVNTFIGEGCFFNFNTVILDVAPVRFGDGVLVGSNTQFLTPTHPVNPQDRKNLWEGGLPITVGDNVWVGGGAIILGGVSIGENAVIGAGSVVTKDVPANAVVVGNPARVVRTVGPDEHPAHPHQYSAQSIAEAQAFYDSLTANSN